MNRPDAAWDPRKYLEFRLFWPYSSGISGQWMSHQIDTIHWFADLPHPCSVAANGGIYQWKDGRTNWNTLTTAHMRNWLECLRTRHEPHAPHAPVEAGYQHSIATIMANAAVRTGERVTFDEKSQEVMAGGKVFHL
jgi:predicted dehydrogenase